MRILRFTFLALSICCIFQACLKNNQEPEIVGPDPLWPEVTLLWPGEDSVITIKDFSKITKVTSSDEKVAQVAIQDKGIKISAGVPGTADIQIIDDGNLAIVREVLCMNLNYMWRPVVNSDDYKTSVVVEASDPAFAITLRDQILQEANVPYGIEFKQATTENGNNTYRHFTTIKPSIVTSGTFTFRALILELNSTSSKEIYNVITLKNREILGLKQDLTERYKTLHPDNAIQKVIVTRYIRRYLLPG